MSLKAIAFRIIIKPEKLEKTSKGGIVLVQDERAEKAATIRGTIVEIGPDAWKAYKTSEPFAGLKVGDKVYYAKYAGKMVKETDDGEDFLVLNDEDIVCKVEENV